MDNTSQSCYSSPPYSHGSSATQPKAFVASGSWNSGFSGPPNWYLDSAATNHITNDIQNLESYQSYCGHDQVTVGNGASLPLQHTCKGLLPTPHFSFCLNKVLHIPSMSTNLVSVNQLTKENRCLHLILIPSWFRTRLRDRFFTWVLMSMGFFSFLWLLHLLRRLFSPMQVQVLQQILQTMNVPLCEICCIFVLHILLCC